VAVIRIETETTTVEAVEERDSTTEIENDLEAAAATPAATVSKEASTTMIAIDSNTGITQETIGEDSVDRNETTETTEIMTAIGKGPLKGSDSTIEIAILTEIGIEIAIGIVGMSAVRSFLRAAAGPNFSYSRLFFFSIDGYNSRPLSSPPPVSYPPPPPRQVQPMQPPPPAVPSAYEHQMPPPMYPPHYAMPPPPQYPPYGVPQEYANPAFR
jgi:hypothetical protein